MKQFCVSDLKLNQTNVDVKFEGFFAANLTSLGTFLNTFTFSVA